MRVGIVTTVYALNYGAVLQAFALQRYIISQGFECEIINYQPNKKVYGRKLYTFNFSLRSIVKNLMILLNSEARKNYYNKIRNFDEFLTKHLILSNNIYKNLFDFNNLPNKYYDFLICGSDQIWNLNLMDDLVFFLPFKNKAPDAKYLSYAASIAEDLTKNQYEELFRRSKHFDCISIRETVSTETFNAINRTNAVTTLDPVFLLSKNEWSQFILNRRIEDKYILCYFLGIDETSLKLLEYLRDKYPYKIVNVGFDPVNKLKADYNIDSFSPFEFISLIWHAEIVINNSFHATAFSVIFEKFFFTVKHHSRNIRMQNVFNLFDIKDCLVDNNTIIEKIVENHKVTILDKEKFIRTIMESKNFLDKALKES